MKVALTTDYPAVATAILSRDFDVECHPTDSPRTEEELIEIFADADGALTHVGDPVTSRVLASNPHLRAVANFGTGVDHIDLAAAEELGIGVTNTPGVLTDATADFTIGMLLALTRRFAEAESVLRRGEFRGWQPLFHLGTSLQGKQFGIVGMGRIGFAVARRASAFGMTIAYHSRSRNQVAEESTGARLLPLDDLLESSDFMSLHCPLTEDTRHLIDRAALARMKRSAFLLNVARGPVVDEIALAEALQQGVIAGAAVDVFEREPEVEKALLDAPNALLLPHIASATNETRTEMARVAATNLRMMLRGERPMNPVKRTR